MLTNDVRHFEMPSSDFLAGGFLIIFILEPRLIAKFGVCGTSAATLLPEYQSETLRVKKC